MLDIIKYYEINISLLNSHID